MKTKMIKLIFFVGCIILGERVNAQDVTIDYQAWNPANPPCNLFAAATNVPATIDGSAGTIQHQTEIGQPEYNTTGKYVEMACTFVSLTNTKGTKYRIAYNFKKDYSYTIYVTARANISTVGFSTGPWLRIDINNNGGGGGLCSGPQSINPSLSGNPAPVQLSTTTFAEYQFPAPDLSAAHPTLEISAVPAQNGGTKVIYIRKIEIVETPPAASFTLAPASLNIPCGSTTAQTFTVTNESGTPGVTNYKWNLGASNGWLYNGNPAPQTINTTADSIVLTPVCGVSPNNVYATVTANGHNYNTDTSVITITAPSLSISGVDHICSGSQTYTVSGVPCGAVASWSASPSGIVNLTPNGNQVTVTKASNGDITLKATVNSCSTYSVQKDIAVGVPDPSNIIMWSSSNSATVGNPVDFVAGYPPANRCEIQATDWDVFYMGTSIYTGSFPCIPDNGTSKLIVFQSTGTAYVRARIQNTCGWSPYSQAKPIQVNAGYYTLSPNPSQNLIVITASSNEQKAKMKGLYPVGTKNKNAIGIKQVKIYNSSGKLVKQQQFSGNPNQIQMNVSNLSPGIYIVKISDGIHAEQQKLVIQ